MSQRPGVVVANDPPAVRSALTRILEPHVDGVSVAIDGENLLRQVGNVLPGVVVTDISMPKMNGLVLRNKSFRPLATVNSMMSRR